MELLTSTSDTFLPRAAVGGYREVVVVPAATVGTVTLDLLAGNVFSVTPSGNVTLLFNSASATARFTPWTVRFAASSFTVAWPAGTRFAGGTIPTLSGITYVSGLCLADGTVEVLSSVSGVA